MSSIRFRADQVARLKKGQAGSHVIRYAVKRWRRGDFVIAKRNMEKRGENLLQIYPLWRKPEGVADWQLRAVLDAHWATPDQALQAAIAQLDVVIAAELDRQKAQGPYIVKTPSV